MLACHGEMKLRENVFISAAPISYHCVSSYSSFNYFTSLRLAAHVRFEFERALSKTCQNTTKHQKLSIKLPETGRVAKESFSRDLAAFVTSETSKITC